MAKFLKSEEIEWKQPAPGINSKIANGKNATMMYVHLEKGTTMKVHNHPEEQLGYIIEGKLEFIVGPNHESQIVDTGMFYYFDSNEFHGVRNTIEKTVLMDIFGPVRQDYLHLAVQMND